MVNDLLAETAAVVSETSPLERGEVDSSKVRGEEMLAAIAY